LKKAISTKRRNTGKATINAITLLAQFLMKAFANAKLNPTQIASNINWTIEIWTGHTCTLIFNRHHGMFLGKKTFIAQLR
jgi:hypothetical protein